MSDIKAELRRRLTAALTEVTAAQALLESTLRALGTGGPRAEKVSVTADVSDAFTRLRKAHEELNRLHDVIEGE